VRYAALHFPYMPATSPLTSLAAFVGLAVAVYGAILSTFVYRRDRVEVVIKVRRNMSMVNRFAHPSLGSRSVKFVVVTATNKGKRPVYERRCKTRPECAA
jgi:hypothetical protein